VTGRDAQTKGRVMGAPLTELAIDKIRGLIKDGGLGPGDRLPPEAQLSELLGVSRGSTREAVRALVAVGVLDVRRGDGTFVTNLSAETLLTGLGRAVELMGEESILELVETRRVIEPQVTALAAMRATAEERAEIAGHLDLMRRWREYDDLVEHDADFHAAVARASGNLTLAALLNGISSATVRARVWRGVVDSDAANVTIAEHAAILAAIEAGDAQLAEALALAHVSGIEHWIRAAVDQELV